MRCKCLTVSGNLWKHDADEGLPYFFPDGLLLVDCYAETENLNERHFLDVNYWKAREALGFECHHFWEWRPAVYGKTFDDDCEDLNVWVCDWVLPDFLLQVCMVNKFVDVRLPLPCRLR